MQLLQVSNLKVVRRVRHLTGQILFGPYGHGNRPLCPIGPLFRNGEWKRGWPAFRRPVVLGLRERGWFHPPFRPRGNMGIITGAGLEKEYRPNGSGQAKATEDGESPSRGNSHR